MLSTETIARLNQLCDDSHYVFSEGGVVYWFHDSARQAQSMISFAPARLRDLVYNADATNAMLKAELDGRTAVLKDADLDAFSRFLFLARGDTVAFEEAREEARDLMRRLHEDLRFDAVWWETELDDGWSFDAVLYMMRRSDNRYFALELNWSID
jgi:hypothetical protein